MLFRLQAHFSRCAKQIDRLPKHVLYGYERCISAKPKASGFGAVQQRSGYFKGGLGL